ncbi:MAG: NADPH:quinone oxidoreductase family protein [Rhodobiaceae bacterium]|nr:NADPH:quinone oxidoreductase family protein [Rhodobiaceae bacterium]MCC0056148.1 NADPH:quinone oxidoreductase family protein [Rhodobiaceae bacterium]
MRAVASVVSGGPETLRIIELEDPVPGPGQVRIAVRACGVNYFDFLLIQDLHHTKPPRPYSPGGEVSGIVDAVGEGVSEPKVGDRVTLGGLPYGGMAEKLVTEANYCSPIPDGMSFEMAGGYPLVYGTSYFGLKQIGKMQPGETLLVLGAAGGVGLAAVEIGKAMGAHVVAAVSSAEKEALVREHGADAVIRYPRGPFDKQGAKALADMFKQGCGGGCDLVYDPVGGEYTEASIRALRPNGRSLIVGFPAGIPSLPLNLVLLKECSVNGVFWGPWVWREPEASLQNMRELAQMYEAGKLRPHIQKIFDFEEAADAIAWLGARNALGKVVVRVGPASEG